MNEEVESLVSQYRSFPKEEQIITDREQRAHHCYHATEMRLMPDVVVLPSSTEAVMVLGGGGQ